MGCTQSNGEFGPIHATINFFEPEFDENGNKIETELDRAAKRREEDDKDILKHNEFPYMHGRLKEIDYQAIIDKGEEWKDPYFPHGKHSLFINHVGPSKANADSKKKWVDKFVWKRAS